MPCPAASLPRLLLLSPPPPPSLLVLQAFKLYHAIDSELKDHEWRWNCTDHNVSSAVSLHCASCCQRQTVLKSNSWHPLLSLQSVLTCNTQCSSPSKDTYWWIMCGAHLSAGVHIQPLPSLLPPSLITLCNLNAGSPTAATLVLARCHHPRHTHRRSASPGLSVGSARTASST
jgi:hypothetical protein